LKRDYYEILGLSKSAAEDEIKKAYRKCALSFHPDRNPGDKKAEEKFKEATEAYQVLSDPEKRQLYDRYGHEGLSSAGIGAGFGNVDFGDIFEDILGDFFGGGSSSRRRSRPQRGSDLKMDLEISFEESAFGATKTVEVRREEVCSDCKGDGAKPGTSRSNCSACHGTGHIMASSGFFSVSRTCHRCHGQGSLIQHPCTGCHGSGRVAVSRKVQINIPPGISNGLRLRVSGEGEAGARGGPRGDLYVDIHVNPHDIFSREGDNLICEVPINFVQAALGCEIEVPTLKGTSSLKIPAGTQTGRVFKLKGKGIASLNGHGIGDEEVRILVETPTHLSEKQKELLRQFAELSGEKVNPAVHSFIQKVKDLFK
jgi:molecular chaperone DnaJ